MENTMELVESVLKTTPQRWVQLAETLPPELFQRRPAPREWSPYECLQHVVETERMVFPARIGYLLRGEDFPAFNPGAEEMNPNGKLTPVELAREFGRLREKSLTLLSKVTNEDLDRKARHQELGVVTLGEMINEWAGHDLMHTIQAERAILQPFIEGCGPWKPHFSDHVILK